MQGIAHKDVGRPEDAKVRRVLARDKNLRLPSAEAPTYHRAPGGAPFLSRRNRSHRMPTTLLESHVRPPCPLLRCPIRSPTKWGHGKAASFLLSSTLPAERPQAQPNRKPAGKRASGKCRLQGHSLRGRVEVRAPATGRGGDRVLSGTTVSLVLCRPTRLTVHLSNHRVEAFRGLSCSNFSFKNSVDSLVRVYQGSPWHYFSETTQVEWYISMTILTL